MRTQVVTATLTMLALGITAGCGGDSGSSGDAASATGPIDVWLSNNPEEIAWGQAFFHWATPAHWSQINAQQVAHRIVIFGAVQATGGDASGVGRGKRLTAGEFAIHPIEYRFHLLPVHRQEGRGAEAMRPVLAVAGDRLRGAREKGNVDGGVHGASGNPVL